MRTGYAIRDRYQHGWLRTRLLVEGVNCPVTVWTQEEENAMLFRKLDDAKRMLKILRREHRRPELLNIMDPRWRRVV